MGINKLITRNNLRLAWRRITTGSNIPYKSFFRHIYHAYELDYKRNLEVLRKDIRDGVYRPKPSLRIFVPKPSGLQRPITLLSIEDQIVLQALANLFAQRIYEERKKVENKGVFSNILNNPSDIFMFNKWEENYQYYKKFILEKYKEGNKWVASFDLSEFFATIDHEGLLKIISPRKGSPNLVELAKTCLMNWSSNLSKHMHGIPQGPIASYLLAECFMLNIDKEMIVNTIFARYVDDICIMGKTELEIRRALTRLDILCKEHGLIPNISKFDLRKIKTLGEFEKFIPPWFTYRETVVRSPFEQFYAEDLFNQSISQDGKKITEKSKFRFVLFRSPRSTKILRKILSLWPKYPEHTDSIVAYLDVYQRSKLVINFCSRLIKDNYPYDYVKGALWKLLARMANSDECSTLISSAIDTIKNKSEGCASLIGAKSFLLSCERRGLGNYSKWIMWEKNLIVKSLLAPYFDLTKSSAQTVVKKHLNSPSPDIGLSLLINFSISGLKPAEISINPASLPVPVHNSYFIIGLLSDPSRRRHNPMAVLLMEQYNIPRWNGWLNLFGSEYQHAHSILVSSKALFVTDRNGWLNYIDSFNHSLFNVFQSLLNSNKDSGAISLFYKSGKASGKTKNFGAVINEGKFKKAYPDLAENLQKLHKRRNNLPSSHPYIQKTGHRSQNLKSREQTLMARYFREEIIEVIKICKNYI